MHIIDSVSSKTVFERVIILEEQIGCKDSLPILLNRIEHLQLNVLGIGKNIEGPILERIKAVEGAFYIT